MIYNAYVEVAAREPDVDNDAVMDALADHHPSVSVSQRGWAATRISLPAETLRQAAVTALALVAEATCAEPLTIELMTDAEFNSREGFVPVPELVGATEAAQTLNGSHQRVQQMVDEGELPATVVGRSLVFARPSVDAYKHRSAKSITEE